MCAKEGLALDLITFFLKEENKPVLVAALNKSPHKACAKNLHLHSTIGAINVLL